MAVRRGRVGQELVKTPPAQAARIITAATRGLDVSIAEGLAIASEQFARMAATQHTREAIDAWLAARASRKARLGNQEFTITAATA